MDLQTDTNELILRVSTSSSARSLAAIISHGVYDGKHVTMRAVGAGAVNQGVKAAAIAQGFVGPRGLTLTLRPGFETILMPDGKEVSAITLRVLPS
jgi:stage V sporulation protein S